MKVPSAFVKTNQKWLEAAVPLFSFGGAALAIIADWFKIPLDIHFPAFGCVAASLILAYLALSQPKKDIVAISTPIYAIIFFIVPSETSVGIMLMLLYAISLTILLVRFRRRFGSTGPATGGMNEDPLSRYVARIGEAMEKIRPDCAENAGRVFILFAYGEYDGASALAQKNLQILKNDGNHTLTVAFSVIAGFDAQSRSGCISSSQSCHFTRDDSPFLFHTVPESTDLDQESAVALDNALLLLYAITLGFAQDEMREKIHSFQQFAESLASR